MRGLRHNLLGLSSSIVMEELPLLERGGGGGPSSCQSPCNCYPAVCPSTRWTPKDSYDYMQQRPWAQVQHFYSLLAKGELSLADLKIRNPPTDTRFQQSFNNEEPSTMSAHLVMDELNNRKGGKWKRKTYKIILCYDGSAFDGWQKQPGLRTIQRLVEKALGRFVDGKRAKSFESQGLPVEATVSVAGRTDKGVHAAGQVCSFYTWRKDIGLQEIENEINSSASGSLRLVSVEEVPRTFHPNFSACWRKYVYLLPLNKHEIDGTDYDREEEKKPLFSCPYRIDVMTINRLLFELEGRSLTYTAFARDTETLRSKGDPTICVIQYARAAIVEIPAAKQLPETDGPKALCIELVANRFLRKMVRVLVSTVIREAAAGQTMGSLVELANSACRRASAPPAPACGLCLADVGYTNIRRTDFLIA